MNTRDSARHNQHMPGSVGGRDAVGIALLTVCVIIFTVGWFVGVALLWLSPTWRLRDKILGTLVFPGGLPFAVIVAGFGLPATPAADVPWLVFFLQVLVVVSPVCTAVYLARRAFGPARTVPPGDAVPEHLGVRTAR